MRVSLHLELAAELDIHVVLIHKRIQKARVLGSWRLVPRFHKKIMEARLCVKAKALQRGPEMPMFTVMKVKPKLQQKT